MCNAAQQRLRLHAARRFKDVRVFGSSHSIDTVRSMLRSTRTHHERHREGERERERERERGRERERERARAVFADDAAAAVDLLVDDDDDDGWQ